MDVLDKSSFFIFDIDRTLIDTKDSDGQLIWLKNMQPPYRAISAVCIEDANGSRCYLQKGAREYLALLDALGKTIGYLSVGGLKDTPDENQPSIIIMKMFGIYQYFNGPKHLLYKTATKHDKLAQLECCVFFDDDEKHIAAAQEIESVFVVDRNSFSSWESML